ncbi:MAG TPA: hypothetical protein VFR31_22620 [Thermoanaerobaculia bacterium]|nr:hypothetical protein [Thermoanaerobaculia bacterium]
MRPNLDEIAASGQGKVGKHTNAFLPPDVFYMKIVGELSDDEGREVNRAHWDIGKDIDGLFFLCDIAELESAGPAVRKEAVEVQKKMNIAGAVVLKAPLKARIFAKLILTATNMFKSEKMPVMFVDTPDEAWDWIEKRREEYQTKKKAS